MSISYKQFLIELYQDHIDEAAAFYDQRLLRIEDDVADWMAPSFDDTRLNRSSSPVAVSPAGLLY